MLFLLLAQAATPAPDIQLDIHATAREVRIEQSGETSLEVRAGPDAGSKVEIDRPEADGRTRLRNVDVTVRAEARIADPATDIVEPATNPAEPETPSPQ